MAKLSDPKTNYTRAFYKTVKMYVDNQEKTNCQIINNLQDEFTNSILDKIEKKSHTV